MHPVTIEYTVTSDNHTEVWLETYESDQAFWHDLEAGTGDMEMSFAMVNVDAYHYVELKPEYDFDDGSGYSPNRYNSELQTQRVTPIKNGPFNP